MSKRKKAVCLAMSCLLLLALAIPAIAAADKPEKVQDWGGSVNFWTSDVSKVVSKTDDYGKSYYQFSGNNGSSTFKLWLTVTTDGDKLVTAKTNLSRGSDANISTDKTKNGSKYKLRAARENMLDTQTYCWGKWYP